MDKAAITVRKLADPSLATIAAVASIALAVISTSISVVLFIYAQSRYRNEQDVRMDPTGAARFVPLNEKLEPPSPGRRRIVLFGDSRIESWNPPPKVDNVEFVNRGWRGETTGQALLRLDRDVIRLSPATVVIQYGINDLKGIGLFPGREAEIVETCRRNLQTMVGRLRERKIDVMLLTVFPVGPVPLSRRPIWSNRIFDAVERLNRDLGRLAGPGVEVVDCDPILADNGRMKNPFAVDEFHLTPIAYDAMNRFIAPRLAVVSSRPDPQ